MINKKIKQNQGQIAIIVLLASAIILTLGLSSSKKTITDTKVDTDEELLKEAFNTAESGINNYLNTTNTNYDAGNGSNAVVTRTDIGGNNVKSLSSEGLILANASQFFWLVNHNPNGSIGSTHYSGDITLAVDNNFNGSLKVDYFYIDAANAYKVQRLLCNYGSSNIITNPSASCSTLTVAGKRPLLVIITPLGASTKVTVSGANDFPLQGEQLTSVGVTGNGVKTQVKTRNIFQIPSFFTEAITAKNIIQ